VSGARFEGNEGEWWEVVEDRERYECERVNPPTKHPD